MGERYRLPVAFERITVKPEKMGGQPCICGMRMPVATVVAMVADGMTPEEILGDFPYLEREDISDGFVGTTRYRLAPLDGCCLGGLEIAYEAHQSDEGDRSARQVRWG